MANSPWQVPFPETSRNRTFSTDSGYDGGFLSPPIISNLIEANIQTWICR
jgi:hypothetical protein